MSNKWLNVSELPHFVSSCSQSADATAAVFLISNDKMFTRTCKRKLRTLRRLAGPLLSELSQRASSLGFTHTSKHRRLIRSIGLAKVSSHV